MSILPAIAIAVLGLGLAVPLHAHRVEGLLQASLVEVLPGQVDVEVTLVPGIDIAAEVAALLDTDGDGVFSQAESKAWAARFMAGQRVTADGRPLPLELKTIVASPLAEMAGGHAEIVVRFTADLGKLPAARAPSSARTATNPSRASTRATASSPSCRVCGSAAIGATDASRS